jgi:hypothetical protein
VYELCLGEETFEQVIDRIAARVGVDRAFVELVFRARVRKTTACGTHPDCHPDGAVWGDAAPRGVTCEWRDPDPESLPAMLGAAAADASDVPDSLRRRFEERIASEMRIVMSELVFTNPRCGHAAVCRAEPLYPIRAKR